MTNVLNFVRLLDTIKWNLHTFGNYLYLLPDAAPFLLIYKLYT